LKNYGEMLALLDQQQDHIVGRVAHEILDSVAAINAQSVAIQNARRQRELIQRQFALQHGLPEDATLDRLIGRLPEDYRPLVLALVDENNELLLRVQNRARQNHVLLNRSLDLMQRFLSSLLPSGRTSMYAGNGSLFAPALPQRPIYEAVG
jgi:hypothetical protein